MSVSNTGMYENANIHGKYLIWNNEHVKCLLCFTKKHPLWGKINEISRTSLWDVYEHVMHQNAKIHGNLSEWEYTTTLQKMYPLSVFCFLHTKMLKHMQNTLYVERTALPK